MGHYGEGENKRTTYRLENAKPLAPAFGLHTMWESYVSYFLRSLHVGDLGHLVYKSRKSPCKSSCEFSNSHANFRISSDLLWGSLDFHMDSREINPEEASRGPDLPELNSGVAGSRRAGF